MRNLKTILAMLLAFAMAFSAVGVFAEETSATKAANTTFPDVEGATPVGEAVAELVTYGILSGYPDGTFKPDGQITRAEFAAVITRFKGIADNLAADAVTGFADLDADTGAAWARPYVKAAVDAKIINGFEDGTFRASEPVTYEQAVKMIICAIDYKVIADSEQAKAEYTNPTTTTWSTGYILAANKNGITKNVMTSKITEPASRGTVAVLVSNALSAPKLNITTDKNGNISYSKDDDTIADDRYDTKQKIEGNVTATVYSGIDEQDAGLGENEIKIRTLDDEKTYEVSDELMSEIDLEDILGKKVTAYYAQDTEEIVSISEKSNASKKINQESILNITNSQIEFENAKGKEDSVSVNGYNVIYNGKYVDWDLSDFDDSGDEPLKNGYIEVLDAGAVKLIKVSSFDVYVVRNYDKTNKKIHFKYNQEYNGESFYAFPKKNADKPVIIKDGKVTELESLSLPEYSVINFYKSPAEADGKKIFKMYVTTGAKSGKVTAREGDEIEINDKIVYIAYNYLEYDDSAAASADKKAPFEIGETYSYYLDYTGQIAAVKYSTTAGGSYKYGYIKVVGEEDGKIKIRMIDENGNNSLLSVKDTVKLDGERVKAENLFDELAETAATANNAYNTYEDKTWDALTGDYYYQPIRYSTSSGAIDSIDTVVTIEEGSGDSLSTDIALTEPTTVSSKTLLKQGTERFNVGTYTKVIYVPNNRKNYDAYEMMKYDEAFKITGRIMNIEAFDIDPTSDKAALVIIYAESNPSLVFTNSSPYMIVTETGIDDGQVTLNGYVNGAVEELKEPILVSDKYDYSIVDMDTSAAEEEDIKTFETVAPDDIREGDLIRYVTDTKGEIVAINRWFAVNDAVQEDVYESAAEAALERLFQHKTNTSYRYFRYGMVTKKDEVDKYLHISYITDSDDVVFSDEYEKKYSCRNSKVFEFDGKDVKVYDDVSSALLAITGEQEGGTRVIVSSTSNSSDPVAQIVYIIND